MLGINAVANQPIVVISPVFTDSSNKQRIETKCAHSECNICSASPAMNIEIIDQE